MRIKPGFELRELCGEHIIVASGRENIDFSKVIGLNESAALMWNAIIGKDFVPEDMADALCEEYEVDRETALKDSKKILDEWIENGLIAK